MIEMLVEFGYIVIGGTFEAIKNAFQENLYLSILMLILTITFTILMYRIINPSKKV